MFTNSLPSVHASLLDQNSITVVPLGAFSSLPALAAVYVVLLNSLLTAAICRATRSRPSQQGPLRGCLRSARCMSQANTSTHTLSRHTHTHTRTNTHTHTHTYPLAHSLFT